MIIKQAEYVKDYKIRLLFSNGVTKVVDFKPFLNDKRKLFIPLLDLEYFKNFYVDDITICWPNNLDFCPDVLYDVGKEVKETVKKEPSLRKRHTPSFVRRVKRRLTGKCKH